MYDQLEVKLTLHVELIKRKINKKNIKFSTYNNSIK